MPKKLKYMACAVFIPTLLVTFSLGVNAQYLYNKEGKAVPAAEVYSAEKVLYGDDFGTALYSPQDLCVGADGKIYIADTGNDRIVVLKGDFTPDAVIESFISDGKRNTFSSPKGVFKGGDGLLYICDTGNARVVAIDGACRLKRIFTNEQLIAVNSRISFTPQKVAADGYGNVFVTDPSVYQGIIQYDKNDKFVRFFAPNEVEITLDVAFMQFWKKVMTSEQVNAMERTLPSAYNNLFTDSESFLYTCAYNTPAGQEIKKLNNLGVNMLRTAEKEKQGKGFGDLETAYENYKEIKTRFVDINVDGDDIICAADETQGRMFLYSKDCDFIGVFGGAGDEAGKFRGLCAVDNLNGKYLALDSEKCSITVFGPTPYMNEVRSALAFYGEGRYSESVELWKSILAQNGNFTLAYKSIGRAYFQEGKSREAMDMLKKGDDRYFYSMAFKDYRKEFVRNNFAALAAGAVLFAAGAGFAVHAVHCWILKRPIRFFRRRIND